MFRGSDVTIKNGTVLVGMNGVCVLILIILEICFLNILVRSEHKKIIALFEMLVVLIFWECVLYIYIM